MSVQEGDSRRRPRGLLVVGASLVALGVAAGVWYATRPRTRQNPPSVVAIRDAAPPVGHPAPDFTLPLFSGGTLSLHSLKGKPVLLNFWASWCIPCRTETPLLVRLQRTYGPRGVVFIGVDVEDQERDAREFVKKYHVDYPVVRAPDEAVMLAYRILGIPTTVFIGADGVVVEKFTGGFLGPEGEKRLAATLDRLLREAKP